MVDLGGGSTEFVRGTGSVEAARSVDIGCVRMTERHLHSDPPDQPRGRGRHGGHRRRGRPRAPQGVACRRGCGTLVGLAGSVTTITAHAWACPPTTRARIHLAVTPVSDEVAAAPRDLLGDDPGASGRRWPFMHPGRVDVIGAGALVWDVVVREVAERSGRGDQLTVVSSEHDILDGLALSLTA